MPPETIARLLLDQRLHLLGWLRALMCDAGLSEDVFQDTCVKAIGRAAEFRDAEHLRRWFFTASRHAAIDALRRAGRQARLLAPDALEALQDAARATAAEPAPGNRRVHALRACLEALTPRAQVVLALRHEEELNGPQIATRLTCGQDAIYKILARSYAQLRECIRRREALDSEL